MKRKGIRSFPDTSFRDFAPRIAAAAWFRRARQKFEKLQIASNRDIVANYRSFRGRERFPAIVILSRNRYRGAIPLLFRELRSRDDLIGGAACAGLAMIGGGAVCSRLERMLTATTSSKLRDRIVSAFPLLSDELLWRKTARILMEILDAETESANTRATAAEGLARTLEKADKRTSVFRRAVKSLVHALDDASPNVRCCAIYALGQLEAKSALPALIRVAKYDRGRCRGIGFVRTEAYGAIARIQQVDQKPRRVKGSETSKGDE